MPNKNRMPSSKRIPRRFKRFYKAKRKYKDKISSSMVPNTRIVRMRYSIGDGVGYNLVSTSGSLADYVLRANSCYAPDVTISGHQPYGQDQAFTLWQSACVLGSKAVMTFTHSNTGTTNKPAIIGINLITSSTAMSGVADKKVAQESPRITTKILADNSPMTLSHTFSTKRFFSCTNPIADNRLTYNSADDATRLAYFHAFSYGLNAQSTSLLVSGYVDYIVVFFQPYALTPS